MLGGGGDFSFSAIPYSFEEPMIDLAQTQTLSLGTHVSSLFYCSDSFFPSANLNFQSRRL
jgi:hypothetical protein